MRIDPEAQRLIEHLPQQLSPGDPPATLVTIWRAKGSTPRGAGARLLCRGGRLLAGTIGGGPLEAQAIAHAAHLESQAEELEDGIFTPTVQHRVLEPDLAQLCGGSVWLLFESLDTRRARTKADALRTALQNNQPLQTTWRDETLLEVVSALPSVLIFGGGHVGAALASTLALLPWHIFVIDGRQELHDPRRLPVSVQSVHAPPLELLASWGWTNPPLSESAQRESWPPAPPPGPLAAVIMTHDHDLDADLAAALLAVPEVSGRSALNYTGLIGSKSKIATIRHRLLDRGLNEHQLARLTAPIGLRVDGQRLGSKHPAEIALSTAAELLHILSAEIPTPRLARS